MLHVLICSRQVEPSRKLGCACCRCLLFAFVQIAPYHSASLYVGDLSKDVAEATLFEIFSQVGATQYVVLYKSSTIDTPLSTG